MITSILDEDLYKFSMQQAVLELFPNAQVTYRFTNRGTQRFNQDFLQKLRDKVNAMADLFLTLEEFEWIKESCPYFKPMYLEYLKNYRFNPSEVKMHIKKTGDLSCTITGPWHSTILWEVPLLALISETYFSEINTEWKMDGQKQRAFAKGKAMAEAGVMFADFGTRRRRSLEVQDIVVEQLKKGAGANLVGTSNMFLAKKHGIKPIGTQAHEWVMGCSALESLNHANYYMLQNWVKVYNTELGIALTDTYGSVVFFKEFNKRFSSLYSGVRHDSGNPYDFGITTIEHYKSMGIDPMTKCIVFSDGLDVETAIRLKKYFEGKINVSFGIGTHFSNDFNDSPALNIVIKLYSVNGFPVVKLSDVEGKETGNPNAVKAVRWIYGRD